MAMKLFLVSWGYRGTPSVPPKSAVMMLDDDLVRPLELQAMDELRDFGDPDKLTVIVKPTGKNRWLL